MTEKESSVQKIGLCHFLVSDLICLSSLLPMTTFPVRDNGLFIPN